MKTKLLMFTLILSLAIISCTKDSEPDENTAVITAAEASVNARIDIANDDVSDVVEEQEASTYANTTSGKMESANSTLAICASITRIPAPGTAITPGTLVTKTIDFGTAGCTLQNGNTLKGKIIITFTYQPDATEHTITYTFENFYHNNIKFEGTKTFTRTMTVATPNSPSHPVVVMHMDMTATLNGNTYTRIGQRTREIIEGYGTASWTDNVYRVIGHWTTTFPNTTLQTSTITTPLIVKMSCIAVNKPLIVKGIITFERNNHLATLDYGNGDCDNIAVFTINGNSYNISIGN
jgi:hypothetical protein